VVWVLRERKGGFLASGLFYLLFVFVECFEKGGGVVYNSDGFWNHDIIPSSFG
jgi:hypothetical protein